ncbi:hypothetical protein AVEN_29074-1 [Araneus ventricosus]|uniref:Uncharacterized protein n=1 Tax=Araneus ventricosus TaxID=182803 RepID=A0A4Y2AJK8_ARAVE|nr:hypothetical protein AVEN_29074-1 [Araneus ventricosus]
MLPRKKLNQKRASKRDPRKKIYSSESDDTSKSSVDFSNNPGPSGCDAKDKLQVRAGAYDLVTSRKSLSGELWCSPNNVNLGKVINLAHPQFYCLRIKIRGRQEWEKSFMRGNKEGVRSQTMDFS